MARRGCRDCPRCTEPVLVSLGMIPFRIANYLLTFWNIRLLRRYCPECRHPLKIHKKVGGRYVD